MLTPITNEAGELVGVSIDSTLYSEAAGPRVPRLEPDDYAAIARLSE